MTEKIPRKPKVGDTILHWPTSGEPLAAAITKISDVGIYTDDDCSRLFEYYGVSWLFADETPAPDDITDRLDEAHSLGFRHGLMLREQLSSDLPAQSFADFEKWARSLGSETPAPIAVTQKQAEDILDKAERVDGRIRTEAYALRIAINQVLAPIAERKPRELSDTQCSALSCEPPSKTRFLIATYERMRPGLLEGGQ